ncbi:hypothetical protein [Actinoplanes awajinensis]|nr:hypothetical protein [Actinoplanes awajinensis]
MGVRIAALSLFLLSSVAISACSGDDPAPAATPDPAEASGPGSYAAPVDLEGLCSLLSYEALSSALGVPAGETKAELHGSDPTSSRSVRCTRSLAGANTADGGLVTTDITFWHDVDLAKSQFAYTKGADAKNFAQDQRVEAQGGVGAEAYRYVRSPSSEQVLIPELVARHSNLDVSVQFISSAPPGGLDARSKQLFEAAGAYANEVLATVRKAAPAPAAS